MKVMALPSMLTTAPRGRMKSATSSRTRHFLMLARLMGRVAREELVPAANMAVGRK